MRIWLILVLLTVELLLTNAWANGPTAPDSLRYAVYSDTTIELFWNRSSDDEVVVGYEIARNDEWVVTLDASSQVFRDLMPGVLYHYAVTAIDNDGNRSETVSINVSISPKTPTGLRVAVYSSTSAEFFWNRWESGPKLNYELSSDGVIQGQTNGVSFFTDELIENSIYRYQLVAIDPLGNRSEPAFISVSTYVADKLYYLAPVPRTGQYISFAPGDDGDWQSGVEPPVSRFIYNFDGTFTDNFTDLTWLSVRDCIVHRNWADAVSSINLLAGDGATCEGLMDGSQPGDWRLPNVRELQSLLDLSLNFPAISENIPLSGTWDSFPWGDYWSSTTLSVDQNVAWVVILELGHVSTRLKTDEHRVWAVRNRQLD